MATTKVSALAAHTTTDGAEELLINDGGTSKKVTIANLLHDNSIDSDHYVDGSIDEAHIADDAVTADKLANAINTAIAANTAKTTNATHTGDVTGATALTIAAGAVDIAHLSASGSAGSSTFLRGDNAWASVSVGDDSIDSDHYVDGSIDTAHIGDDQVTYAKIQNVSATDRILGRDSASAGVIEEITPANLRTMINVEDGATADQTAGQILTLLEDGIDSVHYKDGSIDNAHIADDAIDSEHYADGSIDNAHIADDAIDSEHYADGSIDLAHLSADCVDGTKIADDACDSEHYTDGSIDAAHLSSSLGDLSGKGITDIGLDAGDMIEFTNTELRFHCNNAERMRLEADGDLHVDGDVIAYSTTVPSSIALKHDVNIIDNALDKLAQLRGVSFTYNKDNKESAGVIAEEVQKVLPQAVKSVGNLKDESKNLAVNYNALTSILIEAIKELTAKVEKLEKK